MFDDIMNNQSEYRFNSITRNVTKHCERAERPVVVGKYEDFGINPTDRISVMVEKVEKGLKAKQSNYWIG